MVQVEVRRIFGSAARASAVVSAGWVTLVAGSMVWVAAPAARDASSASTLAVVAATSVL